MIYLAQLINSVSSGFDFKKPIAYFNYLKFWESPNFYNSVGDYITGFIILFFGWLVLKIVLRAVKKVFDHTKNMSDLLGEYIIRVLSVLGWIILISTFLAHIGIDMGPLLAGVGITGIVLGLALQDSISNFFSGLMIIVNEPFRKGDYIEVNSLSGTVKSMDLICIQLVTFDGKLITISNKVVWDNPVTNFSFTDKRRISFEIGVPYDTDLKVAKQVFLDLVSSYDEVLTCPKPTIEINEFADSSINFVIRPWVKPDDYWKVYWRFNSEILDKLAKKGISLPFPQLDINITSQN